MDPNEGQEELEEVQQDLRKRDDQVYIKYTYFICVTRIDLFYINDNAINLSLSDFEL